MLAAVLLALQLAASVPASSLAEEACFIHTLCAVKEKVRWRTPKWDVATCERVGRAFVAAAKKYDLPLALAPSVALNESDLNERASRVTLKDGKPYAHDVGLMAIRCVDRNSGTCTNGLVRGLTVKDLLKPEVNIDIGAHILADIRDKGVPLLVEDRGKQVVKPCAHRQHPWWAHYNWGPRSLETGRARHYPHRIAVLFDAWSKALGVEAPELLAAKFVRDKGAKLRRHDKPVGTRIRRLYAQVLSCKAPCAETACAPASSPVLAAAP